MLALVLSHHKHPQTVYINLVSERNDEAFQTLQNPCHSMKEKEMTHMNRTQRRALSSQQRKQSKKFMSSSISDHQRAIYNAVPTMINEDDYIVTECVLCGATMKDVHDTHDARPLAPSQTAKHASLHGNTGRCCSNCNTSRVIPARVLARMFGASFVVIGEAA